MSNSGPSLRPDGAVLLPGARQLFDNLAEGVQDRANSSKFSSHVAFDSEVAEPHFRTVKLDPVVAVGPCQAVVVCAEYE